MIINVWTIVALFLALITGALSLLAMVVSVRLLRTRADLHEPDATDDRAHLLTLLLSILVGVRLIAWLVFYLQIKSYVPTLAEFGVMCAFGVAGINPVLTATIQIIAPVALCMFGLALTVGATKGESLTRHGPKRYAAPALAASVLGLAAAAAEFAYAFVTKTGKPVSCCTQFLETDASRLARTANPLSAMGLPTSATPIAYYVLSLAVIAASLYLARRCKNPNERIGLAAALAVAALGIADLFVADWTWHDVVAPRVLQLPYHHCLYEIITDVPLMAFAAGLAVAGNLILTWPAILTLLTLREPGDAGVRRIQRTIYRCAALALASHLVVVTIHIV